MPALVLNEWKEFEEFAVLTIRSKAIGEVEVIVDKELVPHLRIYTWGYDKKSQRFSYGEAYTRVYMHRKIAEIYERGPVATVFAKTPFDLRKNNLMWRPA